MVPVVQKSAAVATSVANDDAYIKFRNTKKNL